MYWEYLPSEKNNEVGLSPMAISDLKKYQWLWEVEVGRFIIRDGKRSKSPDTITQRYHLHTESWNPEEITLRDDGRDDIQMKYQGKVPSIWDDELLYIEGDDGSYLSLTKPTKHVITNIDDYADDSLEDFYDLSNITASRVVIILQEWQELKWSILWARDGTKIRSLTIISPDGVSWNSVEIWCANVNKGKSPYFY